MASSEKKEATKKRKQSDSKSKAVQPKKIKLAEHTALKSIEKGKTEMVKVPLKKNTIPHQVIGQYKGAKVLLKPAAPGTGIIAGGPVRAVMEAAGIKDILSKSLGSKNSMNIVKAVFKGIDQLMDAKLVAINRGKTLEEFSSITYISTGCSTS